MPCPYGCWHLFGFAEAPLVEDRLPGFLLIDESIDDGEHAGPRDLPRLAEAAVLQDPHHFTGCPHLVELGIGEVAGLDGQDLSGAAVAFALRTVALKARPLA